MVQGKKVLTGFPAIANGNAKGVEILFCLISSFGELFPLWKLVIQYGHLVGHVTRHLPPLYYWLSATLSFLSRISNSITLLSNGQKTALFCVPQSSFSQCILESPTSL